MIISMEVAILGGIWQYAEKGLEIGNIIGALWIIAIITVAAAETAIGLSLVVRYYRTKGSVGIRGMNLLQG